MRDRLRLAIDGTSLLGPRTGVGHVTAGLVKVLAARPDLSVTVFAVTWRGRHDLAPTLPAGARAATAPVPARAARAAWPRLSVPRVERWTGAVDVVHGPNFVTPPSRAPVVLTVHDLAFVRYPELCTADTRRYPRLIRHALDRGATVHVVSDFVADEVQEAFDLAPERVRRIYPGLAATAGGDPEQGRRRAVARSYVLALGTIEPRKNLPTLVRAFDRIADDRPDLCLVVGGPAGWDRGAFAAACASARHGDRVRQLGYVGEPDRRDLLAGASVFAYPSLYEGFGHPPLEAMTAGVPVVAARAGALPEVAGDAALLVDPLDDEALADALGRALDDDGQRTALVARGRERVRRFSWLRAAEDFVGLYRELRDRAVA